jgi:hypothetical protein
MKLKVSFVGIIFFIVFVLTSCAKQDDFPVLKGPYLGQKPPGMTPEIFAPGIVCTEKNEGYLVFLNHGCVLVFDRWLPRSEESNPYLQMEIRDGIWTRPRASNHTQNPYDPDLPISPDERTLFFALNRSTDGMGESETGWDIWMTKWTDQGFSHIRRLAEPVSSEKRDAWASLAQNGNLYFMSNRNGSYGRWDIYKALYEDGRYVDVQNIGRPVNSEESEADPAIAPDESYLLFCSSRPGGFGESDLYITFCKQDGSWTAPQNMGPVINTSADEEKPYVTPDGKYLFFSNDAPGNLEIYWMDARIIDELKAKTLKENE